MWLSTNGVPSALNANRSLSPSIWTVVYWATFLSDYLFQKSTNRRGILSYKCLVCGEGERKRIGGKILFRDRQGTVGRTGVWFPVTRFLERFLSWKTPVSYFFFLSEQSVLKVIPHVTATCEACSQTLPTSSLQPFFPPPAVLSSKRCFSKRGVSTSYPWFNPCPSKVSLLLWECHTILLLGQSSVHLSRIILPVPINR